MIYIVLPCVITCSLFNTSLELYCSTTCVLSINALFNVHHFLKMKFLFEWVYDFHPTKNGKLAYSMQSVKNLNEVSLVARVGASPCHQSLTYEISSISNCSLWPQYSFSKKIRSPRDYFYSKLLHTLNSILDGFETLGHGSSAALNLCI